MPQGSRASFNISITDSDNLQSFSIGAAATLLGNWLKYTAAQSADGYKITYAIGASVSGTQRGSSILNTQLGSSTIASSQAAGLDDYRAQRFPSGTGSTTHTYLFKINKA